MPTSFDILPISSIAYYQCHREYKYELNVANPDTFLHHNLIACRVDRGLGELTGQFNTLCGLYFYVYMCISMLIVDGNIETKSRPSIALNKGFCMSTRVSYFILKGKFPHV